LGVFLFLIFAGKAVSYLFSKTKPEKKLMCPVSDTEEDMKHSVSVRSKEE
jgi:hypothetical protein